MATTRNSEKDLSMRILITTLSLVAVTLSCLAQENVKPESKKLAASKKPPATLESPVKLHPKGEAHPPSIWMQQKLKHSQKIFAAMVEGDLFQVEDSARHLKMINRLENFVRGKSRDYRTQLKLFQFANDEILNGAKEKNLDRVTLGYNQMTISCVKCHKQLRKAE